MSRKRHRQRRVPRQAARKPPAHVAPSPERRAALRRWALRGAIALGVVASVGGVTWGMVELQRHVASLILTAQPRARGLLIPEVPASLRGTADLAVHDALAPLLDRTDWLDPELCRALSDAAAEVGWVKRVEHVRRLSDGYFEVRCRYRTPQAMAQYGTVFHLVDADGFVLPGSYTHDPTWILIQGVRATPPEPGARWEGDDLRAGLRLAALLHAQEFARQITAISVANHAGRRDPRASHVLLATDHAGRRIEWGSAPGEEIEENTAAQKLALLAGNYRQTGRVDRHCAVIGVYTFPDRCTIRQE